MSLNGMSLDELQELAKKFKESNGVKMKTAQAEPREFYIQKTLVTVGAKVEAMYKVYLQMPDNAASNEYNHGDIYFHVIEISAVEALKKELEAVNDDRHDQDIHSIFLKNTISELESQLTIAEKKLEACKVQRNEYIFDEYEPYSHALEVVKEDDAELTALDSKGSGV